MDKLANAVVLTSQGTPFLHAGSELLRTKNGEHNSYNLPDSINQIDWSRKQEYIEVFTYYQNLIKLRKAHPAFYLDSAEKVRKQVLFDPVQAGLVSYTINNESGEDSWKQIKVIYNANTEAKEIPLDGTWKVALEGDDMNLKGLRNVDASVDVAAISMTILFQEK